MKKLFSILTLMSICIVGSAQTDVHCHMIPDSYLEAVKAHGMEMDEGFPIPAWNVEDHLKFMDGAGIQTSVLTMPAPQPYFGDAALEPLMAYLNTRKAVIITHPHKPAAVLDKLIEAVPLASYEYLAETTRAILNMVAHDVLVRYPDLKVVVPHCGSFLPNALPRFKGLLPVMVSQGYMEPVDVEANLSRLYFDLAGAATEDAIESLLTITKPSHILYGSDYPYVAAPALKAAKKSLEARLASHGLDPKDVFSDNAARLFGAEIPVREYGDRIVRLAAIEVYPEKWEEYLEMAQEVGQVSMATEPGVIGLFSMQAKADPCKVYILEVYADPAAYQAHLQTAHFKKYKEGTADMVKSLELIDTTPPGHCDLE